MNIRTPYFNLVIVGLIALFLSACSGRDESQDAVSDPFDFGGDTGTDFTGLDFGQGGSSTSCESSLSGVLTRISPTSSSVATGASIQWQLNLSGCDAYRVMPLHGANNQSYEVTGNQYVFVTTHNTAMQNFQQVVWLQGLNSSGSVLTSTLVTAPAFNIGASQADWTCNISVAQPSVQVPTYISQGQIKVMPGTQPPVFNLTVSSNNTQTQVVSVNGPQATWTVVNANYSQSASTSHQIAAQVSYLGMVPITVTLREAANTSVTKSCQTSVQVTGNLINGGGGLSAPTCQLTVTPQSVIAGQLVTVQLAPTGYVDSASIGGQPVAPNAAIVRYATGGVGTHNITGAVMGPGGQNICSASYQVVAP